MANPYLPVLFHEFMRYESIAVKNYTGDLERIQRSIKEHRVALDKLLQKVEDINAAIDSTLEMKRSYYDKGPDNHKQNDRRRPR
jgi:hypothetical protein